MFNSNTPIIEVKGGSVLSFVVEENGVKGEEENNLLIQTIAPHLSLLMEHGTAKQVGTGGQGNSEETPYVSIIAQAEGKAAISALAHSRVDDTAVLVNWQLGKYIELVYLMESYTHCQWKVIDWRFNSEH